MRSEPIAALQVVEAKAIPMPSVDTAPAVTPALEPVPVVQPLPVVAEVEKETQLAKEVEQPKQVELEKQAEQKEAEQRKAAERKIDHQKRYAERKAREVATTRMKQRQLEEQGEPAKPELAYDRVEEPHFNLFESLNGPLLDRQSDVAPVDRRDRRLGRLRPFGWRGLPPGHYFFKPLFALQRVVELLFYQEFVLVR